MAWKKKLKNIRTYIVITFHQEIKNKKNVKIIDG